MGVALQGLFLTFAAFFLVLDTCYMFFNEYFPRGYPTYLLFIELPAVGAGCCVIWHLLSDTESSRLAIMVGAFVFIISFIAAMAWSVYFTYNVWRSDTIPVGVGSKQVETNYDQYSRSMYAMSTIVWGSLFLVIAIWYAINCMVYKSYYNDDSAEILYAEYEKLNPVLAKKGAEDEGDEEQPLLAKNEEDAEEKPSEQEQNEGGSKSQSMVSQTEAQKEGGDEIVREAPVVDPIE